MSVFGLVPAAGRGERFGGSKLLAAWNGRELLGHVLLQLSGARAAGLIKGTLVVHRPEDDAVRNLVVAYHQRPLALRSSHADLSDTLRAGVADIATRRTPDGPDAILICLGDQPQLRLDVIEALISSWRAGARAVRPSYREEPGRLGHPMLLDQELWPLAAEMRGDTGFTPVIQRRGIAVKTIAVAGSNPDIDTADDLRALTGTAHPKAPET